MYMYADHVVIYLDYVYVSLRNRIYFKIYMYRKTPYKPPPPKIEPPKRSISTF